MTSLSVARFFPQAATLYKQVPLSYKSREEFSTWLVFVSLRRLHAMLWGTVCGQTLGRPENIHLHLSLYWGATEKYVWLKDSAAQSI